MKNLVLYSDQIHPHSDGIDVELKALFHKTSPKIGFIPSASDSERRHYNERRDYYKQLGIDLDVYFELDKEWRPDLLEPLLDCDAIHLSGGNTYYFLYWLRKRDMTDILVRYVSNGGILIGVSAGAILMTPDITTSSICGDGMIEGETDFSGLGLVDFAFVPHFGDRNVSLSDIKAYSKTKQLVVYAARDNGGIVVTGNDIKCIGEVIKIDER